MKIEENIPMPPRKKGGEIANILRAMRVGDSVLIPHGKAISWRSSAGALRKKVAIRKVSSTESRVWLVS